MADDTIPLRGHGIIKHTFMEKGGKLPKNPKWRWINQKICQKRQNRLRAVDEAGGGSNVRRMPPRPRFRTQPVRKLPGNRIDRRTGGKQILLENDLCPAAARGAAGP
ncbi:hypothetical protein ANACOL_04404 [Anaerotruncus colihominis DSM 17241]|uniref:Uncharacterized protein n=1 Tax=Anaerotruncus colihominis DSM 17241 TaxID=445972 RepID=B0PHW2_9FIRM|nr:hypothetical protein ANACOL_04404 [Anaerotruncus colihominis DSM 17241]